MPNVTRRYDASIPPTRAAFWGVVSAAALTIVGVSQAVASRRLEGLPVDPWISFMREACNWFAWAVLVPLVARAAETVRAGALGRPRAIAAWIFAGVLVLLAHSTIEVIAARAAGVVPAPMSLGVNIVARFTGTIAPNLIVLGFVVFVFRVLEHYRETRARELREAALTAELANAQLTVLRMQLQPHFLFNTLHAASSLMERDVAAARRMLVQLGDLLRSSLGQGDAHEVSLERELAFLERYLDIQRLRFEDRLTIEVLADRRSRDACVPSMLLQPLIENALRHGIERRAGPGRIQVCATSTDDTVQLAVIDDGPGLSAATRGVASVGVGLANTRARLQRLYGSHHHFELGPATANGTGVAVRISIPYRSASEASPGGGREESKCVR